VYKGQYGDIDGPSLEDLVKQASATIYSSTDTSVNNATTKVAAMLTPFDLAIAGGPDTADGAKVKQVVDELQLLSVNLLAGAGAINVEVNGIE
jgi:putative iron-regulated protein